MLINMADITKTEIETIVKQVLSGLNTETAHAASKYSSTEYQGRRLTGIFSDMNDAIAAASEGYKIVRAMSVEKREKIISRYSFNTSIGDLQS